MNPSETRKELLDQHARIRGLLDRAQAAAAHVLAGEWPPAELEQVLAELRAALAEHNAAEEAVLEPLLRDADAWGPVRVSRMFEEHAGEHAAFRATLQGDTMTVAERIADFAEELEAHMQAEERTFLSPAVLRDDVIVVESTS